MAEDFLRALLLDTEGETFRFVFGDGTEMLAEVVSATHVEANETIVVLRVGASSQECAWQLQFADIRSVAAPDGRWQYSQA